VLKRSKALWGRMFLVVVACLAAVPASASATTLWVSKNPPKAPYNSCANPGYDHIQQAIAGPGTAIHVCGGTYSEQLSIERPIAITGYESAKLQLPSVTAPSNTPCDTASDEATEPAADQDEISICDAGKVSIKNMTIDAIWPGDPVGASTECGYNLYGILAAGGSKLELSGSTVDGAAPKEINGCQYGVGVEVGMDYTQSLGTGMAKLSSDTISGYDKNGITVAGAGSEATIKTVTVTGVGPTKELAQNGIGVQRGAKATITGATVSGNECEYPGACGPEAVTQAAADGVYFYEAAEGSSISKSTLDGNDVGVEAFDGATVDPLVENDTMTGDRYAAVEISAGLATVKSDVMRQSEVGIQLVQFAGYPLGGSAVRDTIQEMSKWAVLGRSDKNAGDVASSFSITSSKISGNPGLKPQESVESENPPKLKIFAEKDS
jgi:hypothetical protein